MGESASAVRAKRPFGVRLYLTLGFAAVTVITAGLAYLLTTGSSNEAASQRAADITVGRTIRLGDRIRAHPLGEDGRAGADIDTVADEGFSGWVFSSKHVL